MNNSLLISIQPKWCELIASGKKTVEVRKTRPKIKTPFNCYIYCTLPTKRFRCSGHLYAYEDNLYLSNGKVKMCDGFEFWANNVPYQHLNGKVIGEFVCDDISVNVVGIKDGTHTYRSLLKGSCLTDSELMKYGNWDILFGWHISNLVIYDKPKELSEFIVPSKFGCCNEGKCKGCTFLDRGNGFNIEDDCNAPFCTDDYKPLRKAPQSWCYVNLIRKEK